MKARFAQPFSEARQIYLYDKCIRYHFFLAIYVALAYKSHFKRVRKKSAISYWLKGIERGQAG